MTATGGLDAATPEVAAYLAQKEVTEKSRTQLWRRVALVLGVVVAGQFGIQLYNSSQVGDIKSTVTSVKQTVNAHTAQLTCQSKGYDAVLKDARLAISGDHNASDYAKAPRGC